MPNEQTGGRVFGRKSSNLPEMPSARPYVDARQAPRRESSAPGFVKVAGYRINLPCRIADTSANGARLAFTAVDAHHLPTRIIVVFADRTEIDAEIRWRSESECGVRFVSRFRRLPDPPKSE